MYYLWFNEAQSGPYTLLQVRAMWTSGQITAETLYWQERQTEWLPLSDILSLLEPGNAPVASPSVSDSTSTEEVLWSGHPTLWRWFWPLVLGAVLSLVVIGLFILAYVFLTRSSTRYSVSNRRVSVETGILTKTSRELRLQDIRSIGTKVNFLGFGDLEFSSAARDDADVIFYAVPDAGAVRDLVKKLQS